LGKYTLVYLDLLYNSLQKMNERHGPLFENLLSSFTVMLANIFLLDIPENMFLNNFNLEQIQLSNNLMSKVTFRIEHLKKLRVLNLQGNHINTLESSTMLVFQGLFEEYTETYTVGSRAIILKHNPLIH